MKSTKFLFAALVVGLFTFTGCETTEVTTGTITTNLVGLQDLGSDYVYEGWLIVPGKGAVTTGTFTVDNAGVASKTSFEADLSDINDATTFVLSIEPTVDSDPMPSAVKILGGSFTANAATLSIGHADAIGDDFGTAAGSYILATPTDGAGTAANERSGVWWLVPGGTPSLTLPTLPSGWRYEGWAVIGGTPISTGIFTTASGADASAPFSSTANAGPAFPGEDFLMNAPTGTTFPVDLAGKTVVVSVEPYPDNAATPFLLKPLVGMVSAAAVDHTSYNMSNNSVATNPTGTVTK